MYTCIDCAHLDKSRKVKFGDFYNYGCDINGGHKFGYTCGYIKDDKDLKWQGCSRWKAICQPEQINIFDLLQ